MSRPDPLRWIDDELAVLAEQGLRRRLVEREGPQASCLRIDGRELINFGSNDYLALAADPRLTEAVARALGTEGWGAGASPLISGRSQLHERLEARLAEFEGVEAALLFTTGFAANAGAVGALVGRGDVIFADRLNHASLIDGCRLSRADVQVYPHADVDALREILAQATGYRRRLIVTDSLFSMDGDPAPLVELADLAEKFGAMLLVDEAHATGVFGASGRGLAEHLGVERRVHVRIATLSKGLGAFGGFAVGGQSLIDWLVNRARPYVFSTASPAAACAAALAALDIVRDEPQRRRNLLENARGLRARLTEQGWNIGASASHIIPLVVGSSEKALALAARLRDQGIFAPAIRWPTVARDEARLRVSLTAGHTPEMIDALLTALGDARQEVA